ncbi:synaptotagmin-A [Aplysia californica]|uniref:Synaptotagmin-A n=1 Tax=Aplysia californica TaxID=6500 RepID=A0ABM1VT63_APLCA|nr:synaptotagmin-A [Aplysia californica]
MPLTTTAAPPEVTIDLDEWDKLMIVVCVALFLLLVLIIVVCVLSPHCWLYDYCPCQYASRPDKSTVQPVYGSIHDPTSHPATRKGQSLKSKAGHKWHPMTPLRESELSDWSDISMPEIIEMKQDPSGRRRKSSRTSDYSSSASSVMTSPSQPESRLAYGIMFDRAHARMHVRVIQLGNFRVTDPDGAMAPYVKVRVYRAPKHFFTFKLKTGKELLPNNLDVELQTKIQRRTDNPVFNESFEVKVEEPDVTAYTVKFMVCDFDKFSRHVVVGEVTCDLSKLELVSGEEVLYNDLLLNPQDEHLGEIHVALMYLPTAEKLSVALLNARGLRPLDGPKRNMETYIKITLMYDGRQLKKSKTSAKGNDLNPVYNETFVFDVPAYQLDKVYFSIAVIGVEKDKEDGRHLLGRLYIGVNFDPDARAQWLEMVHNARKQVACWHKLQS